MLVWLQISAFAAIGQFVVIAIGAAFAYGQLRDLRRQQEAELVQKIFETLNAKEFASALDFVYKELPGRLKEPAYVRDIAEGGATAATHHELLVMHFFNDLGLLVHTGMVGEFPIVSIVASPCLRAWDRLTPVVELMRRRYPHAYTPFESLVARSRALSFTTINQRYRAETPRLRAQWESTARDLASNRIVLLDDGGSEDQPQGARTAVGQAVRP